jgi:hypothetical protein
MKFTGPLQRLGALAGLLVVTMMSGAPAYAAKADVDLLKSYVGNWKGRGQLIGAETESVVCRLTLSPGNDDKVNYQGRCSLAGTALSVNGTLAYVDASRRYEALMTSNVTFSGVAVGQKSGKGIVFDFKQKDKDDQGNDLTVNAAISMVPDKITVEFQVLFNASGQTLKATVPFTK